MQISSNRFTPRPERLIVFRNCLGMIMSVSTFIIGSGAATPVSLVNFSMRGLLSARPHQAWADGVRKPRDGSGAGRRRRGIHDGGKEADMTIRTTALAALVG